VHISLAELLLLDGDSALQEQWTAQIRERWAACRAFASEAGSEGGAWLDGDAAEGIACDAAMAPVVTGDVNVDALQDLVRLCVELDGRRDGGRDAAWAALEQAVIGKAVDLVSGPGGLASFLRRRQLGARLGGPSLPLDIGYAETIPPGIRNAVVLRDRKCRWAGGCDQPASACEVHHTKHKANGGKTSTADCVLLCSFHHQIAIHRWGWTLVLNPDSTTTAWNKDKTKVLHSHGPPGVRLRAGQPLVRTGLAGRPETKSSPRLTQLARASSAAYPAGSMQMKPDKTRPPRSIGRTCGSRSACSRPSAPTLIISAVPVTPQHMCRRPGTTDRRPSCVPLRRRGRTAAAGHVRRPQDQSSRARCLVRSCRKHDTATKRLWPGTDREGQYCSSSRTST
jgi:hypothetical protein